MRIPARFLLPIFLIVVLISGCGGGGGGTIPTPSPTGATPTPTGTGPTPTPPTGTAIIVDHDCTNLARIPLNYIQEAKTELFIGYGHTSHGSQIADGMTGLVAFINNGGLTLPYTPTVDLFAWNRTGSNGALFLYEGDGYGSGDLDHDCGYYPDWVNETNAFLGTPNPTTGRGQNHPNINVIMWSWCGQASTLSEQQMIDNYLTPMSILENKYTGIRFVYMTGHLDGSGPNGNLNQRNEQIRAYCRANGKILYDFADIESYDPDGQSNYMLLSCDDACNYSGGNWAITWQNAHTEGEDWYNCSSAHSQPLNANRKAYAAWWLWARLAGWDGN
jgi:hypothetical protein